MTVMFVFIMYNATQARDALIGEGARLKDLRIMGYFYLMMAAYNLCPLIGVKAFALQPEKMIEYGLQADAASFAFHVLIELVIGWVLIGMSYYRFGCEKAE